MFLPCCMLYFILLCTTGGGGGCNALLIRHPSFIHKQYSKLSSYHNSRSMLYYNSPAMLNSLSSLYSTSPTSNIKINAESQAPSQQTAVPNELYQSKNKHNPTHQVNENIFQCLEAPPNMFVNLYYDAMSNNSLYTIRHQWRLDTSPSYTYPINGTNNNKNITNSNDLFLLNWLSKAKKWNLLTGRLAEYNQNSIEITNNGHLNDPTKTINQQNNQNNTQVLLKILHNICNNRQARVICIGDVHGCITEVCNLLRKVEYNPGDQVVFLGKSISSLWVLNYTVLQFTIWDYMRYIIGYALHSTILCCIYTILPVVYIIS